MTFLIRIMLLLPLICIYFAPSSVSAIDENMTNKEQDIRYISDFLVINIKNNLEKPYSVTAKVFSGDRVTVLEQKEEYLYVQTEDGSKGWISEQYLKKETPKPIIIQQLKDEVERLQALLASEDKPSAEDNTSENDKNCENECLPVQKKLTEAKQKIVALENTLSKKEKSLPGKKDKQVVTELQNQYKKSQQQLKDTTAKYKLLSKEYEKRTIEMASLESTAAKKDDKTRFMWFGAGAFVFFLGILFGKTGNRKKNKFLY